MCPSPFLSRPSTQPVRVQYGYSCLLTQSEAILTSCCYYCIASFEETRHISLVKHTTKAVQTIEPTVFLFRFISKNFVRSPAGVRLVTDESPTMVTTAFE